MARDELSDCKSHAASHMGFYVDLSITTSNCVRTANQNTAGQKRKLVCCKKEPAELDRYSTWRDEDLLFWGERLQSWHLRSTWKTYLPQFYAHDHSQLWVWYQGADWLLTGQLNNLDLGRTNERLVWTFVNLQPCLKTLQLSSNTSTNADVSASAPPLLWLEDKSMAHLSILLLPVSHIQLTLDQWKLLFWRKVGVLISRLLRVHMLFTVAVSEHVRVTVISAQGYTYKTKWTE